MSVYENILVSKYPIFIVLLFTGDITTIRQIDIVNIGKLAILKDINANVLS